MFATIKHLFFACCQASYLILCRNVFEKTTITGEIRHFPLCSQWNPFEFKLFTNIHTHLFLLQRYKKGVPDWGTPNKNIFQSNIFIVYLPFFF